MANQIIIDIGAVANDGTGDPLRTAFNYVNNNFSNVWATGVANSNISFSGNKILTTNTNGNLVLAPNGTGKVQANVDIVPNANNTLSLGSLAQQWNTVYTQSLEISGSLTTGDLTVDGNLTVSGNIIEIGNIVTDAKTIRLANTATTSIAANGSGITIGSINNVANIASFLYTSIGNIWITNVGITSGGDIRANNIFSNADMSASNIGSNNIINNNNISSNNINFTNNLYGKTATFTGDGVGDNSLYAGVPLFTILGSDVIAQFSGNVNDYTQFNFQNGNPGSQASGDYVITADNGNDTSHFINLGITSSTWDGTQVNSLGNRLGPNDGYLYVQDGDMVIGTSNGTIETWKFGQDGTLTVAGDIIPTANNTQSLGNATNQWSDLYVSNATIYMNSVPISLGAGNILTVNGEAVLSNDSNASITTTGNITANDVSADGWIYATIGVDSQQVQMNDGFGNSVNLLSVDGSLVYESTAGTNGGFVPSADDSETIGRSDRQWSTIYGNSIYANVFYGNGSQLTGLPDGTAIVNGTSQIDIPVANGNIYVGVNNVGSTEFTALGINTLDLAALGNVTADGTVQGNVVTADTAINTAGTIAATGNIEGGNINTDGMITANNQVYAQYFTLKGGGAPGTSIGNLGYGGNIVELQGTAGVNIVTTGDEGGPSWQFDTTGDLTVPNYVKFAGNTFIGDEPGAGTPYFRIDTPLGYPATITTDTDISGNNWTWTFGADGVLTTPGDITGPGSLEIQAAPNGNAYVNLDDISDSYIGAAANLYLLANSDNREWIFDTTGTLTTPGDITVGGDVTGRASANTLVLKAQPATDTYIQLNSIVDSTIQTFANLDIVTDSSNTAQTFAFGTDGSLSVPGNITTTANISGEYVLGNAAFMTGIPASYGNANVADFLDSLGSNAIVTTGNISGGNLLASGYANITGNINGSGATFSGNVTAANFSGNISITGNVTGTSPNVSLVAGSYTYTFDNTGVLSLPAVGGEEGGEINFAIPTANTTLTGPVKVDVYQDRLRFFDGSTNGAYLDLANCPSGVSAAIGYRDIPQISFSANATATGNAAGCHYYSTTAGTLQLTIPDNANVAFPTGATLTIVVNAAGNVIVAQGTGVSLYMAGSSSTGNRTVGAYGLASVMKVATNTWVISGTGVY